MLSDDAALSSGRPMRPFRHLRRHAFLLLFAEIVEGHDLAGSGLAFAVSDRVRVLPAGVPPATQHVRGSNCCDLSLQTDARTGRLIVMSAIDNIVKGASGQAVQNMNVMHGFAETTGLTSVPLFP